MGKYKAIGNYNNNIKIIGSQDGINWREQALIVGNPANRELKQLFGVDTIQEAMQKIIIRIRNDDFSGLQNGDYVDGLDLSGIAASPSGNAPQVWNNSTKNNRFEISGINHYKNTLKNGVEVNTNNHIIFSFVNCVASARINSTNTNAGGYLSSELKSWVDNTFTPSLESKLGITLGSIEKLHSTKGASSWASYKVWPMSEIEVFGSVTYGDEVLNGSNNTSKQLYLSNKVKQYNGSNQWWWTQTPRASDTTTFVRVNDSGASAIMNGAGVITGIGTAFCVSC